MTAYITFRENDNDGKLQYYVLQREFPHFVGIIVNTPIASGTWISPIAGYNLWVKFSGTLRGNIVPNYHHISDEIQSVLDEMGTWYVANRILKDEKKYKKFKIKSNVSASI